VLLCYFAQEELRKKIGRQYKKLVHDIARGTENECTDIGRRYTQHHVNADQYTVSLIFSL